MAKTNGHGAHPTPQQDSEQDSLQGSQENKESARLLSRWKSDMQTDPFASRQPGLGMSLLHRLAEWVSKVDAKAVQRRVEALRIELPEASDDELIELLIKRKCQHTAKVGAATSAVSVVPVLGSFFAMTIGMVIDFGAVITAQAELVLEIAEVYGIQQSDVQRRETVFVVLGIGAGIEQIGSMATQRVFYRLAHHYSRRGLAKALPLMGIAASAGINAFSTYLIGKRAQVYFQQGPTKLGDWKDSLRAVSGLDERKLMTWLNDQGQMVSKQVNQKLSEGSLKGAREFGQNLFSQAQHMLQFKQGDGVEPEPESGKNPADKHAEAAKAKQGHRSDELSEDDQVI
ncbi:MAG: hypothetical protein CVV27_16685 [Candidatus Melainabacteria bacterium HGW-Melainabacteria-1]|nr:MAG: hypothetical protein CVV27_16685 [Candidatus Melainabacteria bacterium HGW-Melainabacteria-1]